VKMNLSEAARALGATVEGADVALSGVSTDTRTIKSGNLFVALRGEHYDGHRFLSAAASAGAVAAMVDARGAREEAGALPLLVVDDTRLALGRLAAHWRSRFSMPLVGLTGSSGKTTVKEMLAAILREAAGADADAVLATRGNLNNDIGMPLMLLELDSTHRYAVIEMGMNHEGEIRYLTNLARPDVAIVNNAGSAHIEFLGSVEAIARAKGEIFEGLSAGGTAVINADDAFAAMWRELAQGARCVDFGLEQPAQVTGTYRLHELESEIVLKTPSGVAPARVAAPGLHNVRNALAAAAAAVALDVPLPLIASGLGRFSGIKGRLQRKEGARGATIIDDTYNANPESVRAAIDVLAQSAGKTILVFGDMGELGADSPRLHEALGSHAKSAGIERVMTLGEQAALTAKAFGPGGRHYGRIEDLVIDLRAALGADVTVLVKGSRFMRMERVVEALTADGEAGGGRQKVHTT
jgi:UDP-N-acetylmuramoyl-tripeptide--D-alanyl-D-alanine ligase